MDRTKEFKSIVQHSKIPQHTPESLDFYINIFILQRKINESFFILSKVTSYETYRKVPLLNTIALLIKELRNIQIEDNVTRDHLEVANNLKSLVETNCLKYEIKLNEMKRKLKKEIENTAVNESSNKSRVNETDNRLRNITQNQITMEITQEKQTEKQSSFLQERKRIVNKMLEVGETVQDMSIMIKLQDEQLRRIDEIVTESDKWLKKTTGQLMDYYDMIKRGRGKIVRFFIFFACVVILFWIFNKM